MISLQELTQRYSLNEKQLSIILNVCEIDALKKDLDADEFERVRAYLEKNYNSHNQDISDLVELLGSLTSQQATELFTLLKNRGVKWICEFEKLYEQMFLTQVVELVNTGELKRAISEEFLNLQSRSRGANVINLADAEALAEAIPPKLISFTKKVIRQQIIVEINSQREHILLKQKNRKDFLDFLRSGASIMRSFAGSWVFIITFVVFSISFFFPLGFVAGINTPLGVVCQHESDWCYILRFHPYKETSN